MPQPRQWNFTRRNNASSTPISRQWNFTRRNKCVIHADFSPMELHDPRQYGIDTGFPRPRPGRLVDEDG
jgi:hypothetical protein